MLDIGGWAEFLLIAVVAFVVIGPKDLPKVLYQIGRGIRYLRNLAHLANQRLEDFIETENFESSIDKSSQKPLTTDNRRKKSTEKKDSDGSRRSDADS